MTVIDLEYVLVFTLAVSSYSRSRGIVAVVAVVVLVAVV